MRTVSLGVLLASLALSACTAQGSETIIGGPAPTSTNPFDQLNPPSGEGTPKETPSTAADYEALFGPPKSTKTTPNSLTGTWAGEFSGGYDARFVFLSDALVVAKKCSSSSTTGVTVTAKVSSSSVKTLESKTSPSGATCQITVRPTELTDCSGTSSKSDSCFTLEGTSLSIQSSVLGYIELTKLSDE
ncbi:MAG: hypothetical protein KF819_38695 [Labilithrix sp.]|nr:hypothetical protein [Labilithrix sp.]